MPGLTGRRRSVTPSLPTLISAGSGRLAAPSPLAPQTVDAAVNPADLQGSSWTQSCGDVVPDSDRGPEGAVAPSMATSPKAASPRATSPGEASPPQRQGGWPLPLKILLAAVVLGFVWSPFLAMLMRLAKVNPDLAPRGQPLGTPDLVPPPFTPGGAPAAGGRRSPAPSP